MTVDNTAIETQSGLTDRDYTQSWANVSNTEIPWTDYHYPEWFRTSVKCLWALSKLDADWDSYGSPPIEVNCLEIAAMFLDIVAQRFPPQPHIGPVPDGGVQVEWHYNGIDLEVEFSPGDSILFFMKDGHVVLEEDVDFANAISKTIRVLDKLR